MFRPSIWLLALFACAPLALGQEPEKPKPVTFNTADGVELQGTLYKSVKENSPVVMLLPSFGNNPNQGDWKGLAQMLAKNGFSVLRFDYRGHGASTVIAKPDVFWANAANAKYLAHLANKKPLPNKIDMKDVTTKPNYMPMVVNDIMAARVALDKMNDNSTVNSSSVYLIGSTDSATSGLMFMTAEWFRPQKVGPTDRWPELGTYRLPSDVDSCGADIAGAIWLSAERHPSVSIDSLKLWMRVEPNLREKNHMLFLYGQKDKEKTGDTTASFFTDQVLVAKGNKELKVAPLRFTKKLVVADTANIGVNLLGNKLGTEETILEFLQALEKDRKSPIPVTRNWTKPPYVSPADYGAFKN